MRAYLSVVPHPGRRARHVKVWLGLIAGAVFAIGPWGLQMIDSHPCIAWLSFALALACGAYTFWEVTPLSRLVRLAAIMLVFVVLWHYARHSIYERTKLSFMFIHPGVFVVQGTGGWMLLPSGMNTHQSIYNVDMTLQDVMTMRAIPLERDLAKRQAMIHGGIVMKHYPEVGPTFPGDPITWLPIDVNNQEYLAQFTYRIGDQSFLDSEEIRIVNVGQRFISSSATPQARPEFAISITVKNQSGDALMHCVDKDFPRDNRWLPGPVCYPGATFQPPSRSLCARCFGPGFEFTSQY